MEEGNALLTIQQVSDEFGIPKPTLRFWEKEFAGILVPARSKGGQRRYTHKDVCILSQIKKMKDKGMSLATIKEELGKTDYEQRLCGFERKEIDLLAERVAAKVRLEIHRLLEAGGSPSLVGSTLMDSFDE